MKGRNKAYKQQTSKFICGRGNFIAALLFVEPVRAYGYLLRRDTEVTSLKGP